MQKIYVDHEDYDHLINTFSGDFRQLLNRIKAIENNVKITSGGINKQGIADRSEQWINPVSKNTWNIRYGHTKFGKKTLVNFYPYTEFSSNNGEKVFLLLSKEDKLQITSNKFAITPGRKFDNKQEPKFSTFLLKYNWTLNIFRGHFFHSFRETVQNSDFTPFQIIYEFAANRKYRLIENFIQNEKWLLYLHKWGVALIKVYDNYLLFETYIAINELKEDQLDAITNHLKDLDDKDYFPTALYLIEGPEWRKFIDIERFQRFVEEAKRINPALGENLENEIMGYWKKYLT